MYRKQRMGLIRKLRPYKWKERNLYIFSLVLAGAVYPFYRLVKKKKRSLKSIGLHFFDAMCCKYQWVIPANVVKTWFENNRMECEVIGECYLGKKGVDS